MRARTREELLKTIDEYLIFLELSENDRKEQRHFSKDQKQDLRVFKNAEPIELTYHLMESYERSQLAQDEYKPSQLPPSLDVTLLSADDRYKSGMGEGSLFTLQRLRSLTPAEARGRIHPYTPHVIEERHASVLPDGRYRTWHQLLGFVGDKWIDVKNYGSPVSMIDNSPRNANVQISLSGQVQIWRQLLWYVRVSYASGTASLLLPCELGAIPDLFKYRDIPAGRQRREALLHWVKEHWRHRAHSAELSVQILDYLRGKPEFIWKDDLQVQIVPSADDLARLVPSKKKESLKKLRTDALSVDVPVFGPVGQ